LLLVAGLAATLTTACSGSDDDDDGAGAPDGVGVESSIYFTEASTLYESGFPLDFAEGRPHGRLLRYEPATGETEVVVDELYFANGVVVAPS
jgi:sugar lactone lactonase YvrE